MTLEQVCNHHFWGTTLYICIHCMVYVRRAQMVEADLE